MANFDNLSTKQVQQEMNEVFEKNMVAGYESKPNVVPDFYKKPYEKMKVSERGFIFGRELKMMEEREK